MGYRETVPPTGLDDLVEAAWTADGGADAVRILPDGCMDLIVVDGRVVIAGPDTSALITTRGPQTLTGLRFRPGVLPRLLGVPAARLVGLRVPLDEVRPLRNQTSLMAVTAELSSRRARAETAPWSLDALRHVTTTLATGATVEQVASDTGWSTRTLQR